MGKLKAAATAIEEELQRQATAAAIASARKVIGGAVPAGSPVGKLNDTELGWLVCAGIFSWISKRAEQASHGGFDLARTEEAIRNTGQVPEPWDAGAVAAILPNVAEIPGMPWDAPIGTWPKDAIVRFLCAAFAMIQQSMKCRDAGEPITRPAPVLNDAVPY
jgi:hypothetical protein